LDLDGCLALESLPESLGQCLALVSLNVSYCARLETLPSLVRCQKLQKLSMYTTVGMSKLPSWLGGMKALEQLSAPAWQGMLTTLTDEICECVSLTTMTLFSNALERLPDRLGRLRALQELDVHSCGALKSLPESLSDCTALTRLDLKECRQLAVLPHALGCCRALWCLQLANCTALTSLPESLRMCTALTHLNLQGCTALTSVPELADLHGMQDISFERAIGTRFPTLQALQAAAKEKERKSKAAKVARVTSKRSSRRPAGVSDEDAAKAIFEKLLEASPMNQAT